MQDALKHLILEVPVALSGSVSQIMTRAGDIGREAGFDTDWFPESLEEAVYEILISSGGTLKAVSDNGVTPRPDLLGEHGGLFTIEIELRATEDESLLDKTDALRPEGWPRDHLSACLSVLMAQAAPLDFDIEIVELRVPEGLSNHERIQRAERIVASQALGKSS